MRQAKAKAGPLVTDNGNFIIDWHFDAAMKWEEIGRDLNDIPGLKYFFCAELMLNND